ncbi:DUF871 domain-containing protein [Streptococcus danieliae]|uniref:DUF871 domain-containing protein n=1 Tax=Streptococcus danieliae TaxID=747656 RepID=A0A7Z0M7G5_9STRE|nr:MupG family TIM beta-alpha barrel fold protein [Streptococcus danieliae]MBF0700046.1 DUF871 domain-containing protein [Streptococcus danieliae]NYS97222.1 DUF871 domain-containing protein [Streptococcus danieliae]
MIGFGFSLYPENYGLDESRAYMELLKSYGASRLFMSLLQLEGASTGALEHYRQLISIASDLGFQVVADVSPGFVEANGWQGQVMERAADLGLYGIRLDEALPLEEIVAMTHNPYGIKIELNLSTDKQLLMELLSSSAQREALIACHNFYPHAYTGLSQKHFLEMSAFFKKQGIRTAAFVSAQTASEGPWPLEEGLPTLEEHRFRPLAAQIEWFKATGLIDDILIANQFVSREELEAIRWSVTAEVVTLEVEAAADLSAVEQEIIAFPHVYRGDISDYLLRSTQPRLVFAQESLPPRSRTAYPVQRGDVLMDNDLYGRYKGELQLVLQDFEASPKVNRVGRISEAYVPILDLIQPWQDFRLRLVKAEEFH